MYPTRPRRTLGRCNKSSELLRSIFRVHTQDLKRKNAAHTELSVASPFPSRWEVRSRLSIQSGRAAGSELQGMKVVSAPVTNDKHLHSQPTEETHRDTQRPARPCAGKAGRHCHRQTTRVPSRVATGRSLSPGHRPGSNRLYFYLLAENPRQCPTP